MAKTSTVGPVRTAATLAVLLVGPRPIEAQSNPIDPRRVVLRLGAPVPASLDELLGSVELRRHPGFVEQSLLALAQRDERVGIERKPSGVAGSSGVAVCTRPSDAPALVVPLEPDALVVVEALLDAEIDEDWLRELARLADGVARSASVPGQVDAVARADLRSRLRVLRQRLPTCSWVWRLELGLSGQGSVERAFLTAAVDALAARPDVLAAVLLETRRMDPTVVRHAPTARAIARILASPRPRAPAAAALGVELALQRQDAETARRWAFARLEYLRGDSEALRELADALGELPSVALDDVRRHAFELALHAAPSDPTTLRAAFQFFAEAPAPTFDRARTETVGRRLVGALGDDARALNSYAWRLLTEDPWSERCQRVALLAARRMQSLPGWETHWRLDTVALAEFSNGNVEAAVRLQERALAACRQAGGIRPRYVERLERYRAALGRR